jgi:hypothetical protein
MYQQSNRILVVTCYLSLQSFSIENYILAPGVHLRLLFHHLPFPDQPALFDNVRNVSTVEQDTSCNACFLSLQMFPIGNYNHLRFMFVFSISPTFLLFCNIGKKYMREMYQQSDRIYAGLVVVLGNVSCAKGVRIRNRWWGDGDIY